MREAIPDNIIRKAVDIWCKKLMVPFFDNGDKTASGALGFGLATMLQEADKSKISDMPERIETFRSHLTSELIRLRDNPCEKEYFPNWLDVDYSPSSILAMAADKAEIPHSQFSCKSHVSMRSDCVSASFGYGAPNINYYPLPCGDWLVVGLSGVDIGKVIDSVINRGNPLGLTIEA